MVQTHTVMITILHRSSRYCTWIQFSFNEKEMLDISNMLLKIFPNANQSFVLIDPCISISSHIYNVLSSMLATHP